MSDRKLGIHITVDDDIYQEYRNSLTGTRFDKNGIVNASAALRYHILSVVEEKKKDQLTSQNSELLQTNDEFVMKGIDRVLETDTEVTDEVIGRQVPEKQMKIYNYFQPINGNIVDRLKHTESKEEVEREVNNRVTEEEYKQIQEFSSPYYEKPLTTEQQELRRRLKEFGKV